MDVVLDSVALNHLLRQPKRQKKKGKLSFCTALDKHIRAKLLVLAVDKGGGLIHEWGESCGRENVTVAISIWEAFGGVVAYAETSLGPAVTSRLYRLHFRDACDKLILRVCNSTTDKWVVSEDADFWDPTDGGRKGDQQAPVARLISDALGITVQRLKPFVERKIPTLTS